MDPVSWQLVIDARDPHDLADFWAAALGGEVEDHSERIESMLAAGYVSESDTVVHRGRRSWNSLTGVRTAGVRILLQQVPEAKTTKNRLHVDLNVGSERLRSEVDRLVALGAVEGREFHEHGGHWIAMTDPEGNEFDVQ